MEDEESEDKMNVEAASHVATEEPSSLSRPMSSSDLVARPCASETVFKIVSATYGPTEGHRLLTGELSNGSAACIPFTRDAAPFLNALLLLARKSDDGLGQQGNEPDNSDTDDSQDSVRITGHKRHAIPLMDGKQMNIIFGDPCPGNSKRLSIHYVTYEVDASASSALEVHRVSFSEYDRVVLRHRVTQYQDDIPLRDAVAAVAAMKLDTNNSTLQTAVRMGRAQSIAEFAEICASSAKEESKQWRLRSATSEITLPIFLPFLEVTERVLCKLVCIVWRNVIRYQGVAKKIDVKDDTAFPRFTRPILRGLLANSHHSLQSLFLSDFSDLTKNDLHPAIPHLRKLRCLDVSWCNNLDDDTLLLIAEHIPSTLEVLYLKGLKKVTDRGVLAIAQSCRQLQVLEISNVPITDDSAIAIGENLIQLRALYMRDNYRLTNRSVDVITEKCTLLRELTLWGCTRLRHLSFESSLDSNLGCGQLVLLNLWGCHSLSDEASVALGSMKNLRTLILGECHRLTNTFLVSVSMLLNFSVA